jgi:hypothetical protein
VTACNAEEKAAASTPATGGLSAFTYCLMSAFTAVRNRLSVDQIVTSSLHADAGNRLRALNLTQTPLVMEPPAPPGLASRSFVTLQAVAPVPAGSPADGPLTSTGQGGESLSIDNLVRMVLANMGQIGTGVSKGGDAMPTATATAPAAVGTLPAMDEKGFWDYFDRIAPVALQLIGTLSKEYDAGGKGMSTVTVDIPSAEDKGFWDYFNKIAPVALQVIGSLTGGKAFEGPAPSVTSASAAPAMDEKGFWDYFNKIAPVAVQILGQLTKSYDASTKSFTATATKGVVTLDDIPPLTDKGFWDVFRSVAQVAVPLIISAI